MKIMTAYGVGIKHYNHILNDSVRIYRDAVDFLIDVCLKEWDSISIINGLSPVAFMWNHWSIGQRNVLSFRMTSTMSFINFQATCSAAQSAVHLARHLPI